MAVAGVCCCSALQIHVLLLLLLSSVHGLQFTKSTYFKVTPETFVAGGYPRPQDGFIHPQCTGDGLVTATYSIVESEPGPFSIDATTGALSVTQDLDYETTDFYQFHISCADDGQTSVSASATVQVVVSSVNEYFPVIIPLSILRIIPEDTPLGTVIASVLPDQSGLETYFVDDFDAGPHGLSNVRFSLVEPTDLFEVNSTTGRLVLIGSLDSDASPEGIYAEKVKINVCDDTTKIDQCPNLLVNLPLVSINDNLPQFSREVYNGIVPSSLKVGSNVDLGITCTDNDKGAGTFQRIELKTPSSEWEVNPINGTLTLKQEFSSNMLTSTVVLRCLDTGGREDSSTTVMKINYKPTFDLSLYVFTTDPGVPPVGRQSIGNVSATDVNGDNVTYSIQPNRYFTIDTVTGEIVQLVAVNASSVFELRVEASDALLVGNATVRIETQGDGDMALAISPNGPLLAAVLLLYAIVCVFP